MICSIEVPVIRGGWLMQCIDSVLQQTSSSWQLSLLWDQGDALSERLLAMVEAAGHPHIKVHRPATRLGIARARQHLTDHSRGEVILPLDDDDVLDPLAVSRFLRATAARPWAGIVRARRQFIDDAGDPLPMTDWFAFERRQYIDGATIDITNHSQPYCIRRSVLAAAGGWAGFADFEYMGEDCGCFMRVEEHADIELIDEVLYYYRMHDQRTSLRFEQRDADEMWRRIADESLARRQLDLKRINDQPPFAYERLPIRAAQVADLEFVIPFFETDEREVDYAAARPTERAEYVMLSVDSRFVQAFDPPLQAFDRFEIAIGAAGPARGRLRALFYARPEDSTPVAEAGQRLDAAKPFPFEFARLPAGDGGGFEGGFARMELSFEPDDATSGEVLLHIVRHGDDWWAMMRLFRTEPGYAATRLEACLASLRASGVAEEAIHVVARRQSSAANRNEGFRRTSAAWICFLDDDAEVDATALQAMLDDARRHGAKLCGPKLLTPNGRLYCGIPYTDPINLEARLSGIDAADDGSFDITAPVPWLPSTVLLVHRSVMMATGGFDERYAGSQHEDLDFSLRARARGFSCLYVGRAAAIHNNLLRNGHLTQNAEYLKTRWSDRPDLFGQA